MHKKRRVSLHSIRRTIVIPVSAISLATSILSYLPPMRGDTPCSSSDFLYQNERAKESSNIIPLLPFTSFPNIAPSVMRTFRFSSRVVSIDAPSWYSSKTVTNSFHYYGKQFVYMNFTRQVDFYRAWQPLETRIRWVVRIAKSKIEYAAAQ